MKFNINAPFWQFMTLCTRYFILNVLFVVTLIPVVTIGPARAALYSTVFAYSDNEDINLGREYLRRFKREFLRGIGSSILFVVVLGAAAFSIVFWNSLDTDLAYVVLPVLIVVSVLVALTFEYYYPLQARYENTFLGTLANAFRMPWAAFGQTLALIAIDVMAAALIAFTSWMRLAVIILGFSWLAYAKSLILLRAFARVDRNSPASTEKPDYSMPTGSIQ